MERALNRLAEVGAARIASDGEAKIKRGVDVEDAAEEAAEEQEKYRQYRRARVELMKEYAETEECRRKFLLNYFGEEYQGLCGHCDNCRTGLADRRLERDRKLPFPLKSRVRHAKWGDGMVLRYDGDKLVVLFDKEGEKTMVTAFVRDHGLLEAL